MSLFSLISHLHTSYMCLCAPPTQTYEFIIAEGGVIPLTSSYTYQAIGGKCRWVGQKSVGGVDRQV